ncbi:MAG: hypothetical protein HOQ24_05105 [Mycobacteriaceae bacterium]|nr:hypothetical protein [Mycobacteriaceae bacterium]
MTRDVRWTHVTGHSGNQEARVDAGQRWPGLIRSASDGYSETMIALGLVLLIIGFIANISILWTIGIVLLVIGAAMALLGGVGRPVGGRAHWY